MELTPELKSKLHAASVNTGCWFSLRASTNEAHYDRIDLCTHLFQGKSIIHAGCCDHIGRIDEKIKKDVWMHGILSRVASRCVGYDVDQEAVDYVTSKHGVSNAYVCDLTKTTPPAVSEASPWDYLFLGEVIEHIGSPVSFLSAIKRTMSNCVHRLVLSCPNALRYQNFTNVFKHCEYINSDHRYWFTPFTISKVLEDAGFSVESVFLVSGYPVKRPSARRVMTGRFGFRSLMRFMLLSKFPLFRDSLLIVARFK